MTYLQIDLQLVPASSLPYRLDNRSIFQVNNYKDLGQIATRTIISTDNHLKVYQKK